MNYISLFSGIEAASVAWHQLGWTPLAFAEIEPFCCELLEKRFPDVPNLGDVSGVDWREYEGSVDVVIGGSPCQAFSMAGRRLGLMDERGKLMLEFVRCVREVKPRWVIWENVPGVLSQDGGRAFGTLLGELEDCGYALSWRVLDAQFFGVPQRRRRVFLIGHPLPGCAAGVLFEPDSLRGDNPSSREKRALLAVAAQKRAGSSYTLKLRHTGSPCAGGGSGPLVQDDLSATLATRQDQILFQQTDGCMTPWDHQTERIYSESGIYPTLSANTRGGQNRQAVCIGFSAGQSARSGSIAAQEEVAPTLRAGGSGTNQVPSVCYTTADRGQNIICMADGNGHAAIDEECSGTLKVGGEPPIVASEYIIRRLMPVECERLQGFPDGWTDLGGTPDTPRYRACGNSMAVPVILRLGQQIEAIENL